MSNYEYIISSLPFLTSDYRYGEGIKFRDVMAEIRRDLSEKDDEALAFLLDGFNPEKLDADFYEKALRRPEPFLREYFRFDLNLRNAKVRYLNKQLGREAEQDVLTGKGTEDDEGLDIDLYRFRGGEFEEALKVESVLNTADLLSRERGLDDVTWEKVDALTLFHYFDLTAVLGYVAKLHIVDRWLALDEETGRELFRKLVAEVRGTFKGVNYTE
ncbi:MAG: DUF2764 family protein [Bacteroidales bacterium]|nr:DUF2764 family protein [Bacteroidales bacterium]